MKTNIFIFLITIFCSCNNSYEDTVYQAPDAELNKLLDAAIKVAYDTHLWMQEDNSCIEYDCCWEYVPMALRYKYESNEYLTVEDKEAIIEGLELSPSFIDTLDEFDEFYNLYCYKTYGKEYFETWFDIE